MLVQEAQPVHAVDLPVLAWAGSDGQAAGLSSGGALHPAAPLPMSLRRRVTPMGRLALEAAWIVLAGHGAPRIILSSRHGEYDRTVGLLRTLAEEDGVSPAEFSLAVHHGLAGLLSIATGNKAGHTAIAAGGDTLGSALTEAAACLAEGDETVLVMHFDADLPAEYGDVGATTGEAGVVALLLGQGGTPVQLAWKPGATPAGAPADLLRLLAGETGTAAIGGDRMAWVVRRAA